MKRKVQFIFNFVFFFFQTNTKSFSIISEALKDLSDAPASEVETDPLRKTCLSVKGVLRVTNIRARKSGPFLFVEVTIGVNGSISASAAHRIAQLTRLELMRAHEGRVANAVVHVVPLGSSGLGEQYPSWARKFVCFFVCFVVCFFVCLFISLSSFIILSNTYLTLFLFRFRRSRLYCF
jgi:hypothetical protein